MSLKDYIREPKKDWTNKQWLEYCSVQIHNPWISEEDRLYYRDKFHDLIYQQSEGNLNDKTNTEDH